MFSLLGLREPERTIRLPNLDTEGGRAADSESDDLLSALLPEEEEEELESAAKLFFGTFAVPIGILLALVLALHAARFARVDYQLNRIEARLFHPLDWSLPGALLACSWVLCSVVAPWSRCRTGAPDAGLLRLGAIGLLRLVEVFVMDAHPWRFTLLRR